MKDNGTAVSDTLTVTFDSSLADEAGICVSRVVNGKVVVLKMELGEQADVLYHLLTEQTAKAQIKTESKWIKVKAVHKEHVTTVVNYKTVCLNCGCRKDSSYGNFCPNCGAKMIES